MVFQGRRIFALSACLAVLCAIPPARAQDDLSVEEILQICAKIEAATERLACFEDLARVAAPETSEALPPKPTADAETPKVQKPDSAQSEEVAPAKKSRPQRYVIKRAEDYEKEKAERAKPPKREAYVATVLKAWALVNGDFYIALTNGEIWKKNDPVRPRPIKQGENVRITPAFMGGWIVKFEDGRTAFRIKQVK